MFIFVCFVGAVGELLGELVCLVDELVSLDRVLAGLLGKLVHLFSEWLELLLQGGGELLGLFMLLFGCDNFFVELECFGGFLLEVVLGCFQLLEDVSGFCLLDGEEALIFVLQLLFFQGEAGLSVEQFVFESEELWVVFNAEFKSGCSCWLTLPLAYFLL